MYILSIGVVASDLSVNKQAVLLPFDKTPDINYIFLYVFMTVAEFS